MEPSLGKLLKSSDSGFEVLCEDPIPAHPKKQSLPVLTQPYSTQTLKTPQESKRSSEALEFRAIQGWLGAEVPEEMSL